MYNRRKILFAGIKSGLIAGIIGATLFGVYLGIVFAWISKSIWDLSVIPFILAFGIPIGLLSGSIFGLIMGYVVYKNNKAVQYIKIFGVIIGGVAGSILPLSLILLPVFYKVTISQDELQEALLYLPGGLLCCGFAGLVGSRRFLRSFSQTELSDSTAIETL